MENKIGIEIKVNKKKNEKMMFSFQFRQRKTLLSLFDINLYTSNLIFLFFLFLPLPSARAFSLFLVLCFSLFFFFLILSSEDPNVLWEFTSNWQVNWMNFDYLHFGLSVYPNVFIIVDLCFYYFYFNPSILSLHYNPIFSMMISFFASFSFFSISFFLIFLILLKSPSFIYLPFFLIFFIIFFGLSSDHFLSLFSLFLSNPFKCSFCCSTIHHCLSFDSLFSLLSFHYLLLILFSISFSLLILNHPFCFLYCFLSFHYLVLLSTLISLNHTFLSFSVFIILI